MSGLGLGKTLLRRRMIDLEAAKRGDENVSTPGEIARLLEVYYKSQGLTISSKDKALAILKKAKSTALTKGLPPGVEVASKPGELEGVRADAGIVFAKNRPYIISVMTTWLREPDEQADEAIEELSRAAYQYFSRLGAGSAYGRAIR